MSDIDHPASEISYEDMLPLRWHARLPARDGGEWIRLAMEAEETLRGILSLDSAAPESADDEIDSAEIQRLEWKLNLVLDLVAHLIRLQSPMPPARRVCISAQALQWTTDEAPPPGEGLVEIHLSPRYPRGLMLPAAVTEVTGSPGELRVTAHWVGLSQAMFESLEKLIFRQHRRGVALRRKAAPRPGGCPTF